MKRIGLLLLIAASLTLGAGAVWAQYAVAVNRMNSGEVSSAMFRRYDFAKYDSALATSENMMVQVPGPITRRPGTHYVAAAGDSDNAVRLIAFHVSATTGNVLEFGRQYMRVFADNAAVLDGASPYEIVTALEEDELFTLQWAQNDDVMYIVDGNDPPQKLTRTDNDDWTIADVNIITGPFLDENTTDVNVTPSATTGTITLTADDDIFNADHVGALWEIGHKAITTTLTGSAGPNDVGTDSISVFGDFDATCEGAWTGICNLQRSDDDGENWQTIWSVANVYHDPALQTRWAYAGTETEDDIIYRFIMTEKSTGNSPSITLVRHDYIDYGVVRIATYVDANEVTATVLSDLTNTTDTRKWSEGAWSDYRGWPKAVAFHEQRLFFAGTTDSPQTIWASQTASGEDDDYENFSVTAIEADDASFSYILPGKNSVQWLHSETYLVVGTDGGIGRWGDATEPMTPTNPTHYRSQTRDGCNRLAPANAGDTLLYAERGGRRIRELTYSLERDGYLAPDMTVLADHVLGDGIVDMAFQSKPYPVLWCVRDDGVLAAMTYQRQHEVVAWGRHITDGTFESVTVIPTTGEDQVWFLVNRTIDGSAVRMVEYLGDQDWGDDAEDCFFVDCGTSWDGGAAVVITGVTQADPGVVTVATWPSDVDGTSIADGDQVKIAAVGGMTDLNGNIYTVDDADESGKTFSLDNSTGSADVDTSGFDAYTSGGTAQWFEKDFVTLSYLEGKSLDVLGDGDSLAQVTVSAGAVDIGSWCNVVHVGIPYTPLVETLPLVVSAKSGASLGKRSRYASVKLDFYKSLGVKIGPDTDNLEAVRFYDAADNAIDPLFTGWKNVSTLYGWKDDLQLVITQADPYPMTLRAIVYQVEVSE